MFRKILNTENETAALILRLILGVVIFPHGAQKLLGWYGGHGFSGSMDFFTGAMGIPAVFAFLAIVAEFFGSLGLITGFLTRIAAFGIGVVMVVATFMVHLQHGFFMNWSGQQQGEGYEYHLLVLGIVAALLIKGAGRWSVDRLLTHWRASQNTTGESGSETQESRLPGQRQRPVVRAEQPSEEVSSYTN